MSSETPSNHEFKGNLDQAIDHLLTSSPDTPSDLSEKLKFAKQTLAEETSGALRELRESFNFEESRELTFKNSQNARLALAQEIDLEKPESLAGTLIKILQKELIETELNVDDLSALSVDKLIEMEKSQPGTLLFAFTSWGDMHKDLSVKKFAEYLPKAGDVFEINFRGNESAYWGIGAGNLLPEKVSNIKVTSKSGAQSTSTERDDTGFYEEGVYIPVFDDYKVEILSVGDIAKKEEPESVQKVSKEARQARRAERRKTPSTEVLKINHTEYYDSVNSATEYFKRTKGVEVKPFAVFGVISKESGFNTNAVSSTGCMGLGQFSKGTWIGFIKANETLARSILQKEGLELPDGQRNMKNTALLELRKIPNLNIYAMAWHLADLGKIRGHKTVDSSNIADIYLNYHEGTGGRNTLEKCIKTGKGYDKLQAWQKKGKGTNEEQARAYWQWLNVYAHGVARESKRFEGDPNLS